MTELTISQAEELLKWALLSHYCDGECRRTDEEKFRELVSDYGIGSREIFGHAIRIKEGASNVGTTARAHDL